MSKWFKSPAAGDHIFNAFSSAYFPPLPTLCWNPWNSRLLNSKPSELVTVIWNVSDPYLWIDWPIFGCSFSKGAKRLADSSGLWLLPAEALHTFVSKPPQRILSCPPTSSALQGRILQRWLLLPAVRSNKTNQSEPILSGVLNSTKLKAILKCDFQ